MSSDIYTPPLKVDVVNQQSYSETPEKGTIQTLTPPLRYASELELQRLFSVIRKGYSTADLQRRPADRGKYTNA